MLPTNAMSTVFKVCLKPKIHRKENQEKILGKNEVLLSAKRPPVGLRSNMLMSTHMSAHMSAQMRNCKYERKYKRSYKRS